MGSKKGNISNVWRTSAFGKLKYRSTASLLLITSYTISSPADFLRWNTPDTSLNILVAKPSISTLSRLLGFNDSRRYFLLRLFDLAYSFRLRFALLVSAGFILSHFCSFLPFLPRVEINIEVDEEDDDEDDIDIEIDLDVEDEDTDDDN